MCRLDERLVVKVADFGLAKDVYASSYYKQAKETRLPVKWMAIESLQDHYFSAQSDVVSHCTQLVHPQRHLANGCAYNANHLA